MKKVITAIGNQNLNEKLQKESDIKIMCNDILYKEGVLEFLEGERIDILILSTLLPGQMEMKELVEKIRKVDKNIEIILLLENQNQELENYLYDIGIHNIFYHNQVEITKLIELIKQEKKEANQEMEKRIEGQREEQEIKELNAITTKKEIICVTGTSGVGKSVFSVGLAKAFTERKNKILIIDFDVLNNSLHTILGIKKYSKKVAKKIQNNNLLEPLQIEELIMKINAKVDLIAGINLLFDSKYQISKTKVKSILDKLKENYDVIIIDTSSECFLDYTKEIMKNSSINIFMVEPNLIEIKKAKRLLNIYINQWKIPQNYFNIIFNKYNENAINETTLKKVFQGFFVLGKLSSSSKYNLVVNNKYLEKSLQKEYNTICKKIIKNVMKVK